MKRSGPIPRKTRLQSHTTLQTRTRLKTGRSTGKPTKAQAKHLEQITHGECICCWMNYHVLGLNRADHEGCDAQHTLSGGRRIGHAATLGMCPWHHRGVRPSYCATDRVATASLGPSFAHGSKPFRAVYGDDAYLMQLQGILHTGTSSMC